MTDPLLDEAPARPIWLVTLADVMLLLVGFFVFLQANQSLDPRRLARAVRSGFDAEAAAQPVAVEANRIAFAARAADAPLPPDVRAWVAQALADPRTAIRITGGTAGAGDTDPATGSAAILAADRARFVAAALSGDVAPGRLSIAVRPGAGRAVQLDLIFTGQTR